MGRRLDPKRRAELRRKLARELPKVRRGQRLALYRRLARQYNVSVDTIRYYVSRNQAEGAPVNPGNPDLLETAKMPDRKGPVNPGDPELVETQKVPKDGLAAGI